MKKFNTVLLITGLGFLGWLSAGSISRIVKNNIDAN
jgi:hypothetical protein